MISFVLLNKTYTSLSRPNFKPQWPCISNNWCMTKASCFSCSQAQDGFWRKLMLCNFSVWGIKWKNKGESFHAIPSVSPSTAAAWPGSKQRICTRSRVCPLLPGTQHSYKRREQTLLRVSFIWVHFGAVLGKLTWTKPTSPQRASPQNPELGVPLRPWAAASPHGLRSPHGGFDLGVASSKVK